MGATVASIPYEGNMSRIFEPKRNDVTGGWRKVHDKQFHNLDSSPDILNLMKSRTMKCVRHVAASETTRNTLFESGPGNLLITGVYRSFILYLQANNLDFVLQKLFSTSFFRLLSLVLNVVDKLRSCYVLYTTNFQ